MRCVFTVFALLSVLLLPIRMQAQQTIPYVEHFGSSLPSGWSHIGWGTYTMVDDNDYYYSYACYGGTGYALQFENGSQYSEGQNIIVMPSFDQEISGLMIDFYHVPDGYSGSPYCPDAGSFEVGYVTDASDPTSFVSIETYQCSDFTNLELMQSEAYFSGAPEGARIAFRHNPDTYNYYWHIDEVTVSVATGCPRPSGLVMSQITEESATLSWNEVESASSYAVYLNGELVEDNVTDNTYTFSDLAASTQYTVGVSTDCGDEQSAIASTTFRTACGAIANLPWNEDFASSAAIECWTILDNDNRSSDDWSHNSDGYVKTGYNSSEAANDWLITPAITLADAGNYLLEFRAKGSTYSNSYSSHLTVRLSTSGTDTASFTQQLFGETLSDDWDDYSAVISVEGGETIYIAFIHDSYNDNGPSLDDVSLGVAPSCLRPNGVSVSAITENSATIVIDDPTEVGSYHLVVNQGSTVVFDEEISETEYELSDLAPSTFYTVSISAVCDDGNETGIRTTTFHTECAAIELPYSVSFAQTIDPCWSNPDGNMYIASSEQALYTYSSSCRLISMAIPEPLSDKLVRIVWRGYSSNYSTQVGIGDQNGDSVQWIATSPAVDDYTESMIFLNQYTGTQNHLVIGGGEGYMYIRSITIETVSGCTPVAGLHTENLTSTEATIAWNEVEDANGYIVEYRPASSSQWTVVEDVDGTTATLSDLTATTDYAVRVRTDCGDDTSYTMSTTFTTLCATEEFPWSCPQSDLYTIGNANWTSCWSFTSGVYRSTSNGILYVYCQGANTEFRLPPVDITDFSQTQLRLHAACTTAGAQFCVGVRDGDVTEWIDTITATLTSSVTDAVEYVIPLGNYQGNGKVVVFGGVDSKLVYVQAFFIEPLDECPPVSNLTVSDISESGATLSWVSNGAENEWAVYLNGELVEIVGETSYPFSELTASTQYTVSVSAICGDGDTSRAVQASFRTPCAAITALPWNEDFATADAIECWTILDNDNNSSDDWDYSSNGYMETGFNASTDANDWLITPPITIADAGNYLLEFRAKGNTYSSYSSHLTVRLSTSGTDTASFTQQLLGETISDNWDDYSAVISVEGGETIYIAFIHDSYNDDGPSIDDVRFGVAPNCLRPNGVSVSDITETSATIVIDDPTEVNNYHVVVKQGNTVMDDQMVSSTTYEVSGLSASTAYTVSVSAVCDDESETSARNTTFRTECGVTELPYSYDCEDLVSSQTPDCYTNLGSGYITTTTYYYHGGNKAIEFYPNDQTGSNILVLPIFEQPTDQLKLQMWHRPEGDSESGSFSVGYITDLSDTGSFVPVATYQASMGETYAQATITFEDAPEDARIAMRHMPNSDYTNWYWFVDDIAVSLNDGSEPQGIDAADMAMVRLYPNPTTTSVSVEFEGMASINVVDMNGRQVLTTEADGRATLDVSGLAKGAYFVRVTSTTGTAVSKLVVK